MRWAQTCVAHKYDIVTLVLKGGICHFAKWQIPPFNAKVTIWDYRRTSVGVPDKDVIGLYSRNQRNRSVQPATAA